MSVTRCPSCNSKFKLPPESVGKNVRCKCGHKFIAQIEEPTKPSGKIRFECTLCGKRLKVSESLAGKKTKCRCGHVMVVPDACSQVVESNSIPNNTLGEPPVEDDHFDFESDKVPNISTDDLDYELETDNSFDDQQSSLAGNIENASWNQELWEKSAKKAEEIEEKRGWRKDFGPAPIWGYAFCVACLSILILTRGGAIWGFAGGALGSICLQISRQKSWPLIGRILACSLITVSFWGAMIALILTITADPTLPTAQPTPPPAKKSPSPSALSNQNKDDDQFSINEYLSKGNYQSYNTPTKEREEDQLFQDLARTPTEFEPVPWKRSFQVTGEWGIEQDLHPKSWIPSAKLDFPTGGIQYLRIPGRQITKQFQNEPRLAQLDGPYAIYRPIKDLNNRFESEPLYLSKAYSLPQEEPDPYELNPYRDHQLIDLRSAKSVGKFSHLLPLWNPIALSPDGEWVVTSDPIPEEIKIPERSLFVWKKNKLDSPQFNIPYQGLVTWFSFIDTNRILFTDISEDVSFLKCWDLSSNKAVFATELDPNLFHGFTGKLVGTYKEPKEERPEVLRAQRKRRDLRESIRKGTPPPKTEFEKSAPRYTQITNVQPNSLAARFYPRAEIGCVSEDGKFLALAETNQYAISIFNLEEGSLQGRFANSDLPQKGHARSRMWGMTFVDSELWTRSGNSLLRISLHDGSLIDSCSIPSTQAAGSLSKGPLPGTFVAGAGGSFTPYSTLIDFDGKQVAQFPPILYQAPDGTRLRRGQKRRQGLRRTPIEVYVESKETPIEETFVALTAKYSLPRQHLAHEVAPRESLPLNAGELSPDLSKLTFLEPKKYAEWSSIPSQMMPEIWRPEAHYQITASEEGLKVSAATNQGEETVSILLDDSADLAKLWSNSLPNREVPRSLSQGKARYRREMLDRQEFFEVVSHRLATDLGANFFATSCRTGKNQSLFVWRKDGKLVRDFSPYKGKLDWYGWGPDARILITVGDGNLTIWDLTKKQIQTEVQGGYTSRVTLSPDHEWVAVCNAVDIDIYSVRTGKLVNRIPTQAQFAPSELKVSPSGRWLAAVVENSHWESEKWSPSDLRWQAGMKPRSVRQDNHEILLVDLQNDTRIKTRIDQTVRIGFLSDDHLLASHLGESHIYDLKLRKRVAIGPGAIQVGKDGSLWRRKMTSNPWSPYPLERIDIPNEDVLMSVERSYGGKPTPRFQLDIDLIEDRNTKQQLPELVKMLEDKGIKFGNDGWVLQVSAHTKSVGRLIEASDPSALIDPVSQVKAEKFTIPAIMYTWKVFDPNGNELDNGKAIGNFPMGLSKYYKGPLERRDDIKMPPGLFNFPGNPTKLMAEEILKTGQGLRSIDLPAKYKSSVDPVVVAGEQSVTIPVDFRTYDPRDRRRNRR